MTHWFQFLLFVGLMGISQNAAAQDTLYWKPTYKLAWSDFKGNPNLKSRHLATTSSGIAYTYHLSNKAITYKVIAFFDRNKSWKKRFVNEDILKHEQGHFDITEIYARKLEAAFGGFTPDPVTVEKTLEDIADKIIAEKNSYQKQYDAETNFGHNALEQRRWEQLIASRLNAQ